MSNAMTLEEMNNVLSHIRQHNGPYGPRVRHTPMIKYVAPQIDMRDGMCYAISFRNAGEETVFHTQNECRDLPETLYERVMKWLTTPVTPAIPSI